MATASASPLMMALSRALASSAGSASSSASVTCMTCACCFCAWFLSSTACSALSGRRASGVAVSRTGAGGMFCARAMPLKRVREIRVISRIVRFSLRAKLGRKYTLPACISNGL